MGPGRTARPQVRGPGSPRARPPPRRRPALLGLRRLLGSHALPAPSSAAPPPTGRLRLLGRLSRLSRLSRPPAPAPPAGVRPERPHAPRRPAPPAVRAPAPRVRPAHAHRAAPRAASARCCCARRVAPPCLPPAQPPPPRAVRALLGSHGRTLGPAGLAPKVLASRGAGLQRAGGADPVQRPAPARAESGARPR